MDEFLQDINADVFWYYMINYAKEQFKANVANDVITIRTKYSESEIIRHEHNIFEYRVNNTYTDQCDFFLHFQMKNLHHATSLFNELVETIRSLVKKPKIFILLSCSGGMTTSFFASELNEAAKMLSLDYEFNATAYYDIDQHINDYEMVLLAPQIAYELPELQLKHPGKLIMQIPSKVFAKYDCREMLEIIGEVMKKKEKEENEPITLGKVSKKHGEILTLIIIRNSLRIHIDARIFGRDNEMLEDEHVVKTKMTLNDLFDLIDVQMAKHHHIDAVAIALPGVIHNGVVDSMSLAGMTNGINLEAAFKKRYTQKLILCNDVNSVAVGYHACQNQYHNISILFQTVSAGAGIGHVIHDQLLEGQNGLAGEIQFMPLRLSSSRYDLNKTVKGTIELVTQEVLFIIASVSPELIVICSGLLPGTSYLIDELKKYIDEQYIPKIVQVSHIEDYSFIGGLLLCIEALYDD